MVPPCHLCGYVGYEALLIYCEECKVIAQHRYCLDQLPSRDPNIRWSCEECKPRYLRTLSSEKHIDCPENSNDRNQKISSHGKTVELQKLQTYVPDVSQPEMINGDNSPCTPSEQGDKRQSKRRRRLILLEEDLLDQEYQSDDKDQNVINIAIDLPAKPPLSSSQQSHTYSYDCPENSNDRNQKISSHGKTVELQKLQTDVPDVSQPEMINNDNSPSTPSEQGDKRQSKRRRRLILPEEDLLDQEYQSDDKDQNVINIAIELPAKPPLSSSKQSHTYSYDEVTIGSQITAVKDHDALSDIWSFYAEPIINHVWRGEFSFENEKYGPFVAHASTKAHIKVSVAAKMFPLVLDMEKLSRLDAWPNSFKNAPPTDLNIGLFFFSVPGGDDTLFDQLVKDITDKDLMLKFVLDEAELLVFSSILLPEFHCRFQSKYYLWGTFRRRQDPALTSTKSNCNSLSEMNSSDKGVRDEGIYDDSDLHSSPSPRASDVVQNSPNNSSHKVHESEYLSRHFRQSSNDLNSDSIELSSEVRKKNQIQGTKLGLKNGDQSESEVELHGSPSPKASDVIQNSPKYSSPEVNGSEYLSGNSISNEILSEIQKINQIHVSELGMKKSNRSESAVELEEGEILDERVEREEGEFCVGDYGGGRCLQLFPLGIEDMGIVARCGGGTELNLDLGLR